jgi:hypothetical protein
VANIPKRYLLFAGPNYYPQPAWKDFKGTFASVEEAEQHVRSIHIAWVEADWYQIVDIETLEIVKQTYELSE